MTVESNIWRAGRDEPVVEAPPDFDGTAPEFAIYAALYRMKRKREITDFEFRSQEVDFLVPDYNLAINILAPYWPDGRHGRIASDELRAALLESEGLQVVFIEEADALENPESFVKEAIAGVDHSRLARR